MLHDMDKEAAVLQQTMSKTLVTFTYIIILRMSHAHSMRFHSHLDELPTDFQVKFIFHYMFFVSS